MKVYMNSSRTFVRLASLAVILLSTVPVFAERRLVASDVQRKPLPKGTIKITNDSHRITAFQSAGSIQKALFSLRSERVANYRPFGSVLYQSRAPLPTTVPPHLAAVLREAAAAHSVDPRLIIAVVRQESAFKQDAVSPVGAQGLMQLMPSTSKWLGVRNAFDARENVFAGTKYLRSLLDVFHGDLDLALAAYNAGPGAVKKHGGVPPYQETRNYVASIRRSYEASLR